MPVDVIMPMLGMNQDTGKVVRWLRADGDEVAKGDPLLEVETDKVTVEIEAPAAGTLSGVVAADGAEVPVGQAIAVILAAGEAPSANAVTETATVENGHGPVLRTNDAPVEPRRPLASPKARRLAEA